MSTHMYKGKQFQKCRQGSSEVTKGKELNRKRFWSYHNCPGDIYSALKNSREEHKENQHSSRRIKLLVF